MATLVGLHLGIAGHALEALLELTHVSRQAHRQLKLLRRPWVHFAAIVMVIVGHVAEQAHQEEENHKHQARIARLEEQQANWSRQTSVDSTAASADCMCRPLQ